ncbi:hypothetical protein U91I_02946 [alpha proteobacterium U9-1i]|nr:hypothetical protein U91I_02946 [alpha proteobacterium U9-1i]
MSEVAAPVGVIDRRAWLRENFVWSDGAARRDWAHVDPSLREWRARVIEALHDMPGGAAIFSHFIAINAALSAALKREETIVHRPAHASIIEIEREGDALRLVRLGAEMNSDDVR